MAFTRIGMQEFGQDILLEYEEQRKLIERQVVCLQELLRNVGEIQSIKKGANSAVITIKGKYCFKEICILVTVWHLTVSVSPQHPSEKIIIL